METGVVQDFKELDVSYYNGNIHINYITVTRKPYYLLYIIIW